MPHFLRPLVAVPLIPDYKYEIASVEEDDVCYICREPFSIDDCSPLQITPCGHIVGSKCLYEWLKRQPDKCPYCSHRLAYRPADETSMICALVNSRIGSVWFHVFERYMLDFPCLSIREEIKRVKQNPDWYVDGSVQNSHIIALVMRNGVIASKIACAMLLLLLLLRSTSDGRDPIALVKGVLMVVIFVVNILTLLTLVAIHLDWGKERSRDKAARIRLRRL